MQAPVLRGEQEVLAAVAGVCENDAARGPEARLPESNLGWDKQAKAGRNGDDC